MSLMECCTHQLKPCCSSPNMFAQSKDKLKLIWNNWEEKLIFVTF